MPTYFNRKEQVLDLKLTRYGRHLLSMGKLKPEYYAFFDDDVIYESQFGGHPPVTGGLDRPEVQNKIANRIKETPRIKTQTVFGGVETEVLELNEHIRSGELHLSYGGLLWDSQKYTLYDKEIYGILSPKVQTNVERTMFLPRPLGQSAIGGRYHPAWDVRFYKAPMSASADFHTGSAEQLVLIPQLEVEHIINTVVQLDGTNYYDTEALESGESDIEGQPLAVSEVPNPEFGSFISRVYDDGTYVTEEQDFVFLDVAERNVDFKRENFEVEVFEIEVKDDGSEYLRPLSFFNPAAVTLKSSETMLNYSYPVLDNSYVEYYFNINVDREIDENILCDIKLKDKKRDYFIDYDLEYTCPEDDTVKTYTKNIVDPEEPC